MTWPVRRKIWKTCDAASCGTTRRFRFRLNNAVTGDGGDAAGGAATVLPSTRQRLSDEQASRPGHPQAGRRAHHQHRLHCGNGGAPGLDAMPLPRVVIQLTRSMAADERCGGDTGQRRWPGGTLTPLMCGIEANGWYAAGALPHQEAGPAGGDCRHDRISGQRRGQLYGGEHRLGGRRIYLHLRAEKPPGETGAHALHTEEGGAPSFLPQRENRLRQKRR